MTPKERHETLVKYALEAFDAFDVVDISRGRFEERVKERMAQAAQLWTNEVDEAEIARDAATSSLDSLIQGSDRAKDVELQLVKRQRERADAAEEKLAAVLAGTPNIGAFFTVKEPESVNDDAPPHPTHFEPGDPNKGRTCVRCGTNIPAGCRYVHADWCNKRQKEG